MRQKLLYAPVTKRELETSEPYRRFRAFKLFFSKAEQERIKNMSLKDRRLIHRIAQGNWDEYSKLPAGKRFEHLLQAIKSLKRK